MSNATKRPMNGCKILFLAANPGGTSPLALDKEIREIEAKIRAAEHRDSLELVSKWAVRPDDLLQSLLEHRPQIVHFSGHGDVNGIVLMGANDQLKPVGKEALAYLFGTLKDNIRLVLLNACDSRLQAELITQHIDCVVGMNKPIGDAAAIVFAGSFYRAIGFGKSVQEAIEQGKTALMLEGIREEDSPELMLRPGVDAAQVVLAGSMHNEPPNDPPPVTINELLVTGFKNAFAFIPQYIVDLLHLVQSPKRFAVQQISEGNVELKCGLIFMAISVLIGQLLESNIVPADIQGLAASMVFSFVHAAAYGATLCVAWRLVQGDAELKEMFLVHFYFWGVVNLMMSCWFMAVIGAFRAGDARISLRR